MYSLPEEGPPHISEYDNDDDDDDDDYHDVQDDDSNIAIDNDVNN